MNSGVYIGKIRHRRFMPIKNNFSYNIFMLYIDIDELPTLFNKTPFWSSQRFALAWFRRKDYVRPINKPIFQSLDDIVYKKIGKHLNGPVRMLTHLRYFGILFNPVTFYYCFNSNDQYVEYIIAEITNTPWLERHYYVLETDHNYKPQEFNFTKAFHISPFNPMDMQYKWRFNQPKERLFVHMENYKNDNKYFDATLNMKYYKLSFLRLAALSFRFPFMSTKVIIGIYWQACKLWLKRTPFYYHP